MDRCGKALDQTLAPRDRNLGYEVGRGAEERELGKRKLRN